MGSCTAYSRPFLYISPRLHNFPRLSRYVFTYLPVRIHVLSRTVPRPFQYSYIEQVIQLIQIYSNKPRNLSSLILKGSKPISQCKYGQEVCYVKLVDSDPLLFDRYHVVRTVCALPVLERPISR